MILTDSSGLVANSYLYDSYGRTLTLSETIPQPFTYTGREFDAESGLYYYRSRYYDPQTGRFLSEDPIRYGAGDQNLYRYVFGNPSNFVDPDGLFLRQLGGQLVQLGKGVGEGFAGKSAETSTNLANALGREVGNEARSALESEVAQTTIDYAKKVLEPNKPDITVCPPAGICEIPYDPQKSNNLMDPKPPTKDKPDNPDPGC